MSATSFNAPVIANVQVQSATQLDVYWNAPPPGQQISSYNLRIDGTNVISSITHLSYPVTNLNPNSTYSFEVQAVEIGMVTNYQCNNDALIIQSISKTQSVFGLIFKIDKLLI